mgnify:CR=1 FL=1
MHQFSCQDGSEPILHEHEGTEFTFFNAGALYFHGSEVKRGLWNSESYIPPEEQKSGEIWKFFVELRMRAEEAHNFFASNCRRLLR